LQTNNAFGIFSSYVGNSKHHVLSHFFTPVPLQIVNIDFTNILCAAFTGIDPKSAKKDSQVKQLFALL